jgi:hypothetical protein
MRKNKMQNKQTNQTEIKEKGHEPVKKFSTGTITASVWENEGIGQDNKPTTFNSVTFQKRYKSKDGEWQTANSYNASDLPKLKLVLEQAYEYVSLRETD